MIRNFLRAHLPHKHPHEGVVMGAGYGFAAIAAHSPIGYLVVGGCYFTIALFAYVSDA